jgi:D-alanyl-D-alanine carboxypeptidase/D-alanyl-D-alanine-endopeptidase (penicillin-binding protein 4)
MDYVTQIFPAGGRSGTIANWYAHDPPFVYAKTGTLFNQHCLSGYLRADKGKWLMFSFMHNNFRGGSHRVREEMQKVLFEIKRKY